MDGDTRKVYYAVFTDAWKFMTRRYGEVCGDDSWWDSVMDEASGIAERHKETGCGRLSTALMVAALRELQRKWQKSRG